jgi:hypothetical protein
LMLRTHRGLECITLPIVRGDRADVR